MSDATELAARALQHFNEGTTDRAPSQMRIPVSAYTDEAQFQAERQAVFFESPIAVALSLEIPDPGDFLTQTIMGKPLLFTRDKEACFTASSTCADIVEPRSALPREAANLDSAVLIMRGRIAIKAN